MKDLAEQYGIETGKTYKAKRCPFSKARTTYPRTVVSISDSGNMVEYTSGNPRLSSKTNARTSCRSFADWAGLSNRTQTVPHETKKPTVADLPKYRTYCVACGCEATRRDGQRICDCRNGVGTDKVRIGQSIAMMKSNIVALIRRHEELLDKLQRPGIISPADATRWEKENSRVVWLMADTRRRMAEQMAHMQDPGKRPNPPQNYDPGIMGFDPETDGAHVEEWPDDGAALKQAIPAPHLKPSKIMQNGRYGKKAVDDVVPLTTLEQKVAEIEVEPNGHLWDPEAAEAFYSEAHTAIIDMLREETKRYIKIGMSRAFADVARSRNDNNLRSVGRMIGLTERMAVSMWKADAERAGATNSIVEGRNLMNFLNESKDTQMKWRGLAAAGLTAIRDSGLTLNADPKVENPNEDR